MVETNYKQKRAIDLWIKQGRSNKAKALREAGYSENIASQPDKVFKSVGGVKYLESLGMGNLGVEYVNQIEFQPDNNLSTQVPYFLAQEMAKEELQSLKQKLFETPDKITESSYLEKKEVEISMQEIYTENMEGVFDIAKQDLYQDVDNNFNNFSSM